MAASVIYKCDIVFSAFLSLDQNLAKPENDHTFNNKFLIIHTQTYVHYLRHRCINQKRNVKTEVHIFTKIKNTGIWRWKNPFSVFSFQKFQIFRICTFLESAQCFVGAFL